MLTVEALVRRSSTPAVRIRRTKRFSALSAEGHNKRETEKARDWSRDKSRLMRERG